MAIHTHKLRVVLSLFVFFSFFIVDSVYAKSGCCSGHDGVNCGAGAQSNGRVICNDGSTGSSCLYSEMVMCGGSSNSSSGSSQGSSNDGSSVIDASAIPIATILPVPTIRPTFRPTPMPTVKPTPSSIPKCSDIADSVCPKKCTLGNDIDCCSSNTEYEWKENQGCYPKQMNCSAVHDDVCAWYCSAGNDADCCTQNLTGYMWYENWGCYPKDSR